MYYVARCLLYNKKLCYIAHPNLPDVLHPCVLASLGAHQRATETAVTVIAEVARTGTGTGKGWIPR